jgi:hypothetical protein
VPGVRGASFATKWGRRVERAAGEPGKAGTTLTIISFRHKFIFVKTRKTASTSLEVHFARLCGEDDVVTPITPPSPHLRPRNYRGRWGTTRFYNHMPARLIRRRLKNEFNTFYRFCFERHPIDKCLSHFAMLLNSPHHRSKRAPRTWEAYLERREFPVDTRLYTDWRGRLLVDRIYRYEELPEALADISACTGLPLVPLTFREKSGFKQGVPSADEVMGNPGQRAIIFDAFASSLRLVPYA